MEELEMVVLEGQVVEQEKKQEKEKEKRRKGEKEKRRKGEKVKRRKEEKGDGEGEGEGEGSLAYFQGHKLLSENASDTKVRQFLKTVPAYMVGTRQAGSQ